MTDFILVPHPDFPSSAIRSIDGSVRRRGDGGLDLEFRATGAVDQVRWPEWKGVGPGDRLWEHSCFEAFVGMPDQPGYIELNFTTSGRWAAYRFDGYREGMHVLDNVLAAGGRTFGDAAVQLRRSVRLPALSEAGAWRLGLSAIIEAKDGSKSYWALKHPDGKPDFHHVDCFALEIAAPDPA